MFSSGAAILYQISAEIEVLINILKEVEDKPLTKKQVEFAIHWREEPIIRSLVGAESGEGGREKFLFIAKQVIEHKNLSLTPYEVNDQFGGRRIGMSPIVKNQPNSEKGSMYKSFDCQKTRVSDFFIDSHFPDQSNFEL